MCFLEQLNVVGWLVQVDFGLFFDGQFVEYGLDECDVWLVCGEVICIVGW